MTGQAFRGAPNCPYLEHKLRFEFYEDDVLLRTVLLVMQEDGERRSWISRETAWHPAVSASASAPSWEDRMFPDEQAARWWFADRVCALLGVPKPPPWASTRVVL